MEGFKRNLLPAVAGALSSVWCVLWVLNTAVGLWALVDLLGLYFPGLPPAVAAAVEWLLAVWDWLRWPVWFATLVLALWVFYLAVMHLAKMLPIVERLPARVRWLAWFVAGFGLALDLLVNWVVFTVLCLQLPAQASELVTGRLQRYIRLQPTGLLGQWRQGIARWMEPLLDPFDPTGDHI